MDSENGGEDPKIESVVPKKRYIHSDIYDRLVADEDDLIGLVSYGLYQSAKRRWIDSFELRHGETPSELQVKEFCYTYDNNALSKLMAESQELIFKITEARVEERIEEISRTAFNVRAVQELSAVHFAINKISGYKHHVIGHLAGFAVLVAIYGFVVFAVTHEPTIASVAKW